MSKHLGIVYGYHKSRFLGQSTDWLFQQLSLKLSKNNVFTEKIGLLDCAIEIIDSKLKVTNLINGKDLADLDGIYFRNWRNQLEFAKAIAVYMIRKNKVVITTEISRQLPLTKIGELVELSDNNIPLIDTFIARKKHLLKIIKKGSLPYEFPFILKAANASLGDDNFLIKSVQELQEILEDKDNMFYLMQRFIPNDYDYRIIILGGHPSMAIKRQRVNSNSHLNNTSQGADGKMVDLKDIDKKILKIARNAAKVVGREEVAGVDIIVDNRTSRFYVLEVNKTPQIETGSNVPQKIDRLSEFLAHKLGPKDEVRT